MSLVDEGLLALVLALRVLYLAGSSHRGTSLELQALAQTPVVQAAVRWRCMC